MGSGEGVPFLIVYRVIAVGPHLVRVNHQTRTAIFAESARVEVDVEETRIERTVGQGAVEQLPGVQRAREQVDRSTEGGRADRRRGSRTAVEDRRTDGLCRKEDPGMVRRIVRVVEGDAVVGHAVEAVLEA